MIRAAVLGALVSLVVGLPCAAAAASFEDDVLAEMNRVRANPQAYAETLATDPAPADFPDDPADVAEAVTFLKQQRPLPPLSRDERLAAAALAYAATQGPSGSTGHGEDFSQRLTSRGVRALTLAENLFYGEMTARDVVRQLIVDSGVPDRGHRKNIVGKFKTVGVGCGPHAEYGAMCVIDFAGGETRP